MHIYYTECIRAGLHAEVLSKFYCHYDDNYISLRYPEKRVMEPDIQDNILRSQSAPASTGDKSNSTSIGKFPLPPKAVDNLAKQFPSVPRSEIEEALRHNKLNFVHSVKWLETRHSGTGSIRGCQSSCGFVVFVSSPLLVYCFSRRRISRGQRYKGRENAKTESYECVV